MFMFFIYSQSVKKKRFYSTQFQLGTLAFTSAKPSTSALFGSGGKSWKKVQEGELF